MFWCVYTCTFLQIAKRQLDICRYIFFVFFKGRVYFANTDVTYNIKLLLHTIILLTMPTLPTILKLLTLLILLLPKKKLKKENKKSRRGTSLKTKIFGPAHEHSVVHFAMNFFSVLFLKATVRSHRIFSLSELQVLPSLLSPAPSNCSAVGLGH